MNTKIVVSSLVILAAAVVVVGATIAQFSDTETSTGNTLSFGTIDIAVDSQNPWHKTYNMLLDKPSQTNYVNFTIENVGSNDARIWKRITNIVNGPGSETWPTTGTKYCSSEPEYVEGGGKFDADGNPTGGYTERDNISAFTLYDMSVCVGELNFDCKVDSDGKPSTGNWAPIIPAENQVRVDNIKNTWIKIADSLAPGAKLTVSQSYHLTSWDDSQQGAVTNWAQGDQMSFNIELEARQLTGPGPVGDTATETLENKNPTTWDPIIGDAMTGTLTYQTSGNTLKFDLTSAGLTVSTQYCLIYYADPWPGDGSDHSTGTAIYCGTSDGSGNFNAANQDIEIATDLPNAKDNNYPAGAKVWVVPQSDYDITTHKMIAWNPANYLFDINYVTYDDTNN